MARVTSNITFSNNAKGFEVHIRKSMQDAMTDIVLDLKRVATMSAPKDTGFLQNSATHAVYVSSDGMMGTVGFSAVEDGFDYATWTHNADYNLGEKSLKKKGGRSAFGGGTTPVGKGYLENALEGNRAGYLQYLQEKYNEAVK